jgi:Sec-independent protein translocase protein TatA
MITAVAGLLFLGLIVFGPKKTIEIAQTVGRVLAQVKQAETRFQTQLREEVRLSDKADSVNRT